MNQTTQGLPSGWRAVTFRDICHDISYGYTASASHERVGPKFLRITDVMPDAINWETVPYCEIADKQIDKYLLKKGDIVIARTGVPGRSKVIKDSVNAVFASYLTRWKINEEYALPFFIGYVLQSPDWTKYVSTVTSGSAQPHANARRLGSFQFNVPPLAEQKTIAEILSSFDDKIDLLRRQNKTLEELAQVLFRQWFIANADETWQQQTIGKATTFAKGKKPNETQQVQFEGAVPQILMETFRAGKSLYCKPDGMVIAEENDILMVMDGSIGRVEIGYRGAVGSTIARYRPVSEFNYPFFIFHYLKTREKYIKANVIGSVIPHVDVGLVAGLTLRFPNLNKVQDFETHAEMLFKKKQANTRQIRTLANLRDTLLPKLMRGEIRV